MAQEAACAETFAPNPLGTLLGNGGRWGTWDAAAVRWEGDVEAVFAHREVEVAASGFRYTEGPTWVDAERCLLFSDTIDARIYKWSDGTAFPLVERSGGYDGANVSDHDRLFEPGSNGMTLAGADVYICQHPTHRVVKVALSDLLKVPPGTPFCDASLTRDVVDRVGATGRRLNCPNDVVVGPDGAVWFTDPVYGFLELDLDNRYVPRQPLQPEGHNPGDLPYLDELCASRGAGVTGVYRWKDGEAQLVIDCLERPNGLAFDGTTLWVANSLASEATWVAFDATVLLQGGNVELPLVPKVTLNETILGEMPGPGLSDGFRIDDEHRIWSSMPSGIVVIDTLWQKVIAKVIFNCNTSNVQFGADGDVWVTGLGHVWRLKRKLPSAA
mmetsp:Transcript_24818/g.65172  ORF Transcript_24818/g.65172 Transcript_24818/m.65172 type:complete len:385 (-) Transcript_24818:97-1251(-)